jgi:erythromycin esterase-like protein
MGGRDEDAVMPGTAVATATFHPLRGQEDDYDGLLRLLADRRFVLVGEATHGSREFYAERARITRQLIERQGVTAIAAEADWPDAYRVNRFVMGASLDADATEALGDFKRFPAWMWRNREVVEFVRWLREHNDRQRDPSRKVRFYGLDLYSLQASMEAVVRYLDAVDPAEGRRARARYACFDHVAGEGQAYGYALAHGRGPSCEDEVVAQLIALRRHSDAYLQRDGWIAEDDLFFAEQNAVVVRDAEEYYQQMFRAEVSSWNLRDRHMAATLDALDHHLDQQLGRSRIVVWEHNSHVGDARATDMKRRGEFNVGQLARQRYGDDCALVGFTTYSGEVTAASYWGEAPRRRRVLPALRGSYEDVLHGLGGHDFWFRTDARAIPDTLRQPRLERAIGVIYRPETERRSHYLVSRLLSQYDAVVHLDHTHAVEPLDRDPLWDAGEPPETFPTGF